jgi:pantoate--beta-alanine ligase
MYPGIGALSTKGLDALTSVDPGPLATVLEGAIRPGHFRGVCTVVLKLLNIVRPAQLVMGQKDYQQNAVLRAMIRDLNVPTEHVMCPTVREPDGLAMSSRNRYLSPDQRARAVALYEALAWAKDQIAGGNRDGKAVEAGMRERVERRGLTVQYALPAHADTLTPCRDRIDAPCVLLIAAVNGTTRLIDNMIAL